MKLTISLISLFLLSLTAIFSTGIAFDTYDPTGNLTIRWDVMAWTPDGYVAVVNITNYQKYRTVQSPGWKLQWTWAGQEVIWTMVGARVINKVECSRFKGNIPLSCAKRPMIMDRTAGTPYNQQVAGCCKGGILLSKYQDLEKSTAEFQISVGVAGTTNRTVQVPRNFTFVVPRGGYTCGPARIVAPTKFTTPDGLRYTQALMTWQVVCTYSAFLAEKAPRCCVSLSSSDHRINSACPTCACHCRNGTKLCASRRSKVEKSLVPPVKCSDHMCPVNINWHLMSKAKENESRVQLSINNFNHLISYSDWTLLVDHPALGHLSSVLQANHKRLSSPNASNGEVFWGIKHYNQVLKTSGSRGSTVSLFMVFKDGINERNFTAPKVIYFNGDKCVIPHLP